MQNLFALIGALALSTTGSAAVVFLNAFDAGSAADAGYYRFGTTDTTLDVAGGTLNYTYSSDAANRSGFYKVFESKTLSVGETIILSFTLTARKLASSQNHAFRWAIGNLGDPTLIGVEGGGSFGGDMNLATPLNSGTREMYQFSASTGSTAGFGQYVTGSSSPVHNTEGSTLNAISGFSGPANIATGGAASVELAITRNEGSLDFVQTAFGVESTGTLGSGTDIFNTIAFSFNNAGDYNISLDDISVSVIPEPSAYAALAGFLALTFAVARRRRFRDSRKR